MIQLYIRHLANKLTLQKRDWRLNTIFLLDGASYHKSAETIATMKQLNLKVMISAPYSYHASPIELFFAFFKSKDINPKQSNTGTR
jgi:hypothetical protein